MSRAASRQTWGSLRFAMHPSTRVEEKNTIHPSINQSHQAWQIAYTTSGMRTVKENQHARQAERATSLGRGARRRRASRTLRVIEDCV